jgi:glycosyltransferase involved in cell wall biosynthesis
MRTELGFSSTHFVVGTVGRFDPIKNLPLLVESIAYCANEIGTLRGVLVGDGPELEAIRRLIAERGLTERVVLAGFRADARCIIQCLDLFVISSFSEGTSMALLEALSSGVPVVVTAVGGNTEVVDNPPCGWIVPSDSLVDMAASIREAANDSNKCRGFSRAAKARFDARFTLDAMLNRYREIYWEMLGSREIY